MGAEDWRIRVVRVWVSASRQRTTAGPCAGLVLVCALSVASGGLWAAAAKATEEPDAVARRVAPLIDQLDAADFSVRNDASRQLGNEGAAALPYLVPALGAESREVRFRIQGLLAQQFAFDDVAPPLIQAVSQPYGPTARSILRDRALLQIEEAGTMPFAEQLFEFWGTDLEQFRRHVLFNLADAKGPQEVAGIVEPLVGLKTKAAQFQDVLSRLESLSLSYDHRHSPGFVVAETLAAGLRASDRRRTEFAQRYLQAFEGLTSELQLQGMARSAIRKEIADRANMSDGASAFLVQLLNDDASPRKVLVERTHLVPDQLAAEFFRGLSLPDAKECYRCVGKVHIADMLSAVFISWPDAPRDSLVQGLCDGVEVTVGQGDKPKALVLLDALEGCRDLRKQGLDCGEGVGQQLARRLQAAAVIAPNTREYHPARSTHDRFVQLLALGVAPDHPAFPLKSWERYLAGDPAAIAEEHRLALGQYVGMVEQLVKASASFEHAGTRRFLTLMQEGLLNDRKWVAEGMREVSRLVGLRRTSNASGPVEPALEDALETWSAERKEAP